MTKARDLASAAPAPSTVSATELGYLDGVTSNIQTQIDSKTGGVATDTPPASPTEGQVWLDTDGTTADANFVLKSTLSSTGDIFYASAANTPARLGIGSTGQVLTVSGGIPAWTAPAAGGKVLQMVTTSTTTTTTINTTSFTDTGMTATITPSSTSSKILVMSYSSLFLYRNASGGMGAPMKLVRNSSTDLFTRDYARYFEIGGTGSRMSIFDHSIIYVDSPSSTSALTYKIQARITTTADGGDSNWQNSGPGVMVLLEIGA